MRRRDFIKSIGGAAAWPLAARAQRGVRRVGVLSSLAEDDPEDRKRMAAGHGFHGGIFCEAARCAMFEE
jgi:putative tryptophan/tyrosine transport system substrate-binding protein